MDPEKKTRFTLIRGGGESATAVHRSFVVVSTTAEPLGEPAPRIVPPSRSIVSLGLDGVAFHEFCRILQVAAIRHVVDTRILAVFRGNGFKVEVVERLFGELRIQYDRPRSLESPFTTARGDVPAALQQYSEHLKSQGEALREVGQRAEQGPVLLLGRASEHRGSERERIVEEMGRLGISFNLFVARKEESAIHLMPWPVKAAPTQAEHVPKPARKPRPRIHKINDAQVPLPFSSPAQIERGPK